MTNKMTDLHLVGATQCFPLYWYEDGSDIRVKNKQSSLFDEEPQVKRHDGVSDYALNLAGSKYGPTVTKEDIFYYIYGYLHSPEYRKTFSDDLKLSLPKIDFVLDKNDFDAFVKAGRDLADLHLNYEDREPPEYVKLSGNMDIHSILAKEDICKVKKMRVYPDEHKVVYNEHITVENIPEEAFQYIVNGRSAIGWLADQYQYSVDKDSGIVNDPNEYAGGSYVLKLLLSIITVSVETVKIVNGLPKLNFNSDLTGEACSEN
jgi:predicted helicase